MTDCQHPYEDTREVLIEAIVDNRPLNRIKAVACTNCKQIIDVPGKPTNTITLESGNVDCEHPEESVKEKEVITQISSVKKELSRSTIDFCEKCSQPINTYELP